MAKVYAKLKSVNREYDKVVDSRSYESQWIKPEKMTKGNKKYKSPRRRPFYVDVFFDLLFSLFEIL